jgi:hypothetical protein
MTAGHQWEKMLAQRVKQDVTAWRKQRDRVQEQRQRRELQRKGVSRRESAAAVEEATKAREQAGKTIVARVKSEPGPSPSTEEATGQAPPAPSYEPHPLISPGVILPWDLVLSDQWEGVPARVGRCVYSGCTEPERVALAAEIVGAWSSRWADVSAGLNRTVVGAAWEPPREWIAKRGHRYAPATMDRGDLDGGPFANLERETNHVPAPPQTAEGLVKYHLWTRPYVATMRYQGMRRPEGAAPPRDKPLADEAIFGMAWYKSRWVRHWLPHAAGVLSRKPLGKVRAMMVVEVRKRERGGEDLHMTTAAAAAACTYTTD